MGFFKTYDNIKKLKKKFNNAFFLTQKEMQKTFINKVVENQVFLNTSYTRTLFFKGETPVFSLKRFETDSIVYELLGESKKTPSKRTNRDAGWQNLHFKRLEGNTECFYKQIGNKEDHKGRKTFNSASWLFCDINHKEGTFDLGSVYVGDIQSSVIYEFQDEGDYEAIINRLEWLKYSPTRLISGKTKNNSIDPDSCRISKEECIWHLLPPSSIGYKNLLYGFKRFFKRPYETHY